MHLLFDAGKLGELGRQPMAGQKALLLISSGTSVLTAGTLDRTAEQPALANVEYVLCANIHENPSQKCVMVSAAVARENICDFIVALGGDASVAVAAMAANPR